MLIWIYAPTLPTTRSQGARDPFSLQMKQQREDQAIHKTNGRSLPSKNELARSCRILARLCKNLACKTCMARARDMSLFLHDSCTILQDLAHILQEMVQDFARDAARIITCKFGVSCTFFCKILQELVQDCARKGTYRVHAPSKSCMQDFCTILHDLASSFLLGWATNISCSKL